MYKYKINKNSFSKIRFFVVYVLKNNNIMLFIYNYFCCILNKNRFYNEIQRRSELSIFSYNELVKSIPYYPIEKIKDSNFYGYAYNIKKYAECNNFKFSIEHGLYYEDYIPKASYYNTVKQIMTFSNQRKNILSSKLSKKIITIGPYIHYAKSYYSEEDIMSIKEKYGKILLVFPSHSCKGEEVIFNIDDFICSINSFRNEHCFDSVFVSMYYYDIVNTNFVDVYENAGFVVVTSGHRLDVNFISRQKSIIELSDYTISNSLGTHVGYCIFLNKPHYILKDKLGITCSFPTYSTINQINYISSFFEKYSEKITDGQYCIASKYWGFDQIKSKYEMKSILTEK